MDINSQREQERREGRGGGGGQHVGRGLCSVISFIRRFSQRTNNTEVQHVLGDVIRDGACHLVLILAMPGAAVTCLDFMAGTEI